MIHNPLLLKVLVTISFSIVVVVAFFHQYTSTISKDERFFLLGWYLTLGLLSLKQLDLLKRRNKVDDLTKTIIESIEKNAPAIVKKLDKEMKTWKRDKDAYGYCLDCFTKKYNDPQIEQSCRRCGGEKAARLHDTFCRECAEECKVCRSCGEDMGGARG